MGKLEWQEMSPGKLSGARTNTVFSLKEKKNRFREPNQILILEKTCWQKYTENRLEECEIEGMGWGSYSSKHLKMHQHLNQGSVYCPTEKMRA